MRGRLTDKEKQELRKMLEEQDKPTDDSWLMIDHYARLSKKENPYNFVCKLCSITHLPAECPHKSPKVESQTQTYTTSQYSWYNYDGEGD